MLPAILYGIVVLATYLLPRAPQIVQAVQTRGPQIARGMQMAGAELASARAVIMSIWQAMAVKMPHYGGYVSNLRQLGDRMVGFNIRGVDYTIKATRAGELTIKAANDGPVPAEVLKHIVTEILPNAAGFRPLYESAPTAVRIAPSFEMLIHAPGWK